MLITKLALRNLLGAGLRTWLNVLVLSLSFVAIILSMGFNDGIMNQVSTAMINSEIGGGQYWYEKYDPFDPFSLQDAQGQIPSELKLQIDQGFATPILITQGTIYPGGRIMPVLLKGIDTEQTILDIPSRYLKTDNGDLPILIGARMAMNTNLKIGDYITIRWRDANGTFDAKDAIVTQIMNTTVQTIDNMQIWLPLQQLQEMTAMQDKATIIVMDKFIQSAQDLSTWHFKNHNFLLKDLKDLIRTRTIARSIFYVILLFLAMIAIFDTQVLSVFKRRKEIGTLISLGMTKGKVIQLFTLEGGLHGILAAIVGAIYGIPLLNYLANRGIDIPEMSEGFGLAIGKTLYPIYTSGLVISVTIIVLVAVTIVSYLPTKRIAKLNPTDALRGKML